MKGLPMSGEESRELKASISKVGKACKAIKYICLICFVLFTVLWIVLMCLLTIDLATTGSGGGAIGPFLYVLSHGLAMGALLFVFLKIFSSIVSGESPFTIEQVRRFRLAAALLLLLAVIEAFLSASFSYGSQILGMNVLAAGGSATEQSYININVLALFFAAALFSVSVIFQYGTLLQRLTDETE